MKSRRRSSPDAVLLADASTACRIALLAAAAFVALTCSRKVTLDDLRAAARPLRYRIGASRLSGWPYAPLQPAKRSGDALSDPPPSLKFRALARQAQGTTSDRHEKGVADLVVGDSRIALDDLRDAAAKSNDADVWNDYSAACIARGDELDDPTLAIDGLAASDRALEIDPRQCAAHFNRALALSRLGLLIDATAEWQTSVKCDPNSSWADEAIRQIHDCPRNEASDWTASLPILQASVLGGDRARASALVRAYPQQARAWAETIGLAEWGTTVLGGRRDAAKNWLRIASAVGDALREMSGETMLADATAAIKRAVDRGTDSILAQAHVVYRQGRVAHSNHDPTTAEKQLREAKALFAQAGSPMERVAQYYIGSALHSQSRTDEAATVLDELAASHPEAVGHHALSSQVGWERGECALDRGAISDGIEIFMRSHDLSARAGEEDFAASMDALLASAYDLAGDQQAAWQARRRAFATLSKMRNVGKTLPILDAAALQYVQHHQCGRASALLNLINSNAERTANALVIAHALTQLALGELECGNSRKAAEHLAEVPRWIRTMKDERTQKRAEADLAYAEGLVNHDVGRLDRALDFFRGAGILAEMPKIYLQRARLAELLGRRNEARENVQAGITIVESERLRLRDFGQRASLLVLSIELFEEAIELALRANDEQAAFGWLERARGRALLDMFSAQDSRAEASPLPVAEIQRQLAPNAAILEVVALPDRLVLFAIRRDRFRSIKVPMGRDRLSTIAASFREALTENDSHILEKAAQLHSLLIAPLLPDLAGANTIAVVSDRALSGVPFTALYDRSSRRFLTEEATIVEAPSAAFAIAASQQASDVTADPVLAIAATTFDSSRYPTARALPSALTEASAAASLHPGSRTLSGEDATRSSITSLLGRFRSIHFAGHAVIGRGGNADSALLVAPANGDRGELLARDIANLRLYGTALVVLAACRSANPPSRGDGVENLADAFLAAGVPTVVASAFDLDDAVSARIMGRFHRLVASGTEPSEAVRLAIADEMRDGAGRIRLPMDWANITILGGARSILAHKGGTA